MTNHSPKNHTADSTSLDCINLQQTKTVNDHGWTPLMEALAQNKSINEIVKLLDSGEYVNAMTKSKFWKHTDGKYYPKEKNKTFATKTTPLIIAVRNGNLEAVKVLIKYGAFVGRYDDKGNTALTWAEKENFPEIANELNKHIEETALTKSLRRIASIDNKNRQVQPRPIKRTHELNKHTKKTSLIKALRISSGDNKNRQNPPPPIKRTRGCCK